MKKLFLLVGLCIAGLFSAQANDAYSINDEQVENMFTASTLVVNSVAVDMAGIPTAVDFGSTNGTQVSDKNAAVAFILAFFLGGLGIHRLYLGTKTFTWVGYILTCGGIFGIVPLVDWILLLVGLINDDIGKYVDNPKFFMW
jgi:TM2 domain-containing membrane protein YozV